VNERMLLEAAVVNDPYNRAPLMALVDWLHEYADVTYRGACRVALSISRCERNARELGRAARLLRDDHEISGPLRFHTYATACDEEMGGATIVVVSGSRPPRRHQRYRSNPGAFWYETTITVGARWVCAKAQKIADGWAIDYELGCIDTPPPDVS
jgi:hypothetical protein